MLFTGSAKRKESVKWSGPEAMDEGGKSKYEKRSGTTGWGGRANDRKSWEKEGRRLRQKNGKQCIGG